MTGIHDFIIVREIIAAQRYLRDEHHTVPYLQWMKLASWQNRLWNNADSSRVGIITRPLPHRRKIPQVMTFPSPVRTESYVKNAAYTAISSLMLGDIGLRPFMQPDVETGRGHGEGKAFHHVRCGLLRFNAKSTAQRVKPQFDFN